MSYPLITVVALCTPVQKPLLNLYVCAQSKWNEDFLVPVFAFTKGIGCSVATAQKCIGSGDEIGTFPKKSKGEVCIAPKSHRGTGAYPDFYSIKQLLCRRIIIARCDTSLSQERVMQQTHVPYERK